MVENHMLGNDMTIQKCTLTIQKNRNVELTILIIIQGHKFKLNPNHFGSTKLMPNFTNVR